MRDIDVIDEPSAASCVLDPKRSAILAALDEPGSATSIAAALGLPRQKVNYHLRELEAHGLVELVEQRQRRGLTERVMVASAESYVFSPDLLGSRVSDPTRIDRLSTRYLIALAARIVREITELARRAEASNQPLATLSIDTEIRFASASDRAAFTQDLTASIADLTARYHDEVAPRGRWHRLLVAAHPHPPPPPRSTSDENEIDRRTT